MDLRIVLLPLPMAGGVEHLLFSLAAQSELEALRAPTVGFGKDRRMARDRIKENQKSGREGLNLEPGGTDQSKGAF